MGVEGIGVELERELEGRLDEQRGEKRGGFWEDFVVEFYFMLLI